MTPALSTHIRDLTKRLFPTYQDKQVREQLEKDIERLVELIEEGLKNGSTGAMNPK